MPATWTKPSLVTVVTILVCPGKTSKDGTLQHQGRRRGTHWEAEPLFGSPKKEDAMLVGVLRWAALCKMGEEGVKGTKRLSDFASGLRR